jgi:two-component system phosphate regulon sensor histidine kinase PhoR
LSPRRCSHAGTSLTKSLQSCDAGGDVIRKADILESVPEGIVVSDGQGNVVAVNATAEAILGFSRQRILGRSLKSLEGYIASDSEVDWQAIAQSDRPLLTVSGLGDKTVHVHSAPVFTSSGDRQGTVIILRDVTTATSAERAKSEFTAAISRELRTLTTAVQGYAEALSTGVVGAVSEAQSDFLRIIDENASRALSLTENLIAVSQVETGFLKLEYGEAKLRTLIDAVVCSFRSQLEARQLGVSLELDESLLSIEADPARLRRILDNLVSNAIKFTYPGGHITIGTKHMLGDDQHLPSHCAIWVSDTGIGIQPEEQVRIWTRFYQPVASSPTETNRFGVGLFIVKSLVEAHKGHVWVESKPGEGSTFTVLLPIKRNDNQS